MGYMLRRENGKVSQIGSCKFGSTKRAVKWQCPPFKTSTLIASKDSKESWSSRCRLCNGDLKSICEKDSYRECQNCNAETKEISSRETQKALNNRAASETNPAQEKSVGESLPLNIDFDREIKRTVGVMFWSRWTYVCFNIHWCSLMPCSFISTLNQHKGNCNVISSAKFYASLWDSVIEKCGLFVCTRR